MENSENNKTLEVKPTADEASHNGGWIVLWKKILESDIWVNKPATWFKLWMYMLLKANYTDGNIRRGQLKFNYEIIHNEIPEMTYGAYRTALSWMRSTAMIHTQRRTRLVLVTILKYDTYQPKKLFNSPASARPQLSQSTASAPPPLSISKEEKKEIKEEEKEFQQEVLPALPVSQNISSIKTSSLNGIVSNNKVDNSRPPTSAISSSPSSTFSDLTNPNEFIAYYLSSIKQLYGVTINLKAEDLLYAKKTISSVPGAFRTSENIKSWITWYLTEYVSKSSSHEYFWVTSFSASWEMFYLRRLSKKSMMTLAEGALPNESTELLQNPEVLIQALRKAIQEYQRNITLPDSIRPIDLITADCIYDLLKTESYYNVRSLNEWVQYFAMVYLRHYPMKTNSHSKYVMYFRDSWEKTKRLLREPVWPNRSTDSHPDNWIMPIISEFLGQEVTDETILKSMSFFGIQLIANYMKYKLHQDNAAPRITGIINSVAKSKDTNKLSILGCIYNGGMKYSPKEYVSNKLLFSNWRTEKYLKFWTWVYKDDLRGYDCLYQKECKETDAFYEALLGKPDDSKQMAAVIQEPISQNSLAS